MKSILIRKFTDQGIKEFDTLLANFKTAKEIDEEELYKLVFNDVYTFVVEEAKPLLIDESKSKYTIAKTIVESLMLHEHPELDKDKGLWTWFSALMLKKLVKINIKTGEPKFSEDDSLYIYSPTHNRYYRHLIAFPSLVFRSLGDRGRILLRDTIDERGEVVEQLASVYDIQRNPGPIEAATILYYDTLNDNLVKGAASKPNEEKNIGGQSRRFREVLKQFIPTYDLNAMSGKQIVDILPKEFDRWKRPKVA